MKKVFLKSIFTLTFLTLLTFGNLFGQGNRFTFSQTKSVPNTSQDELFLRAKKALNTSFGQSNLQLLELEEDKNSLIKGYSIMEFSTKDAQLKTVASGSISFIFEVEFMAGSTTLSLTNFVHKPTNSRYDFGQLTTDTECPKKVGGTMKKSRINVWTELKSTAEENAKVLLNDFANSLDKKVDGDVVLTAQTIKSGLPSDIATVGIIILKHELAKIDNDPNASGVEKKKNANKKMHNKLALKANLELEAVVKEYPYKYVIANNRSELDGLYDQGYKYVLDCIAYDNMKQGNFKSSAKIQYNYELYVKDLSNNFRYIITNKLPERSVYDFKLMVIKNLTKAIEK